MYVVGILGGIASGKSTITRMLGEKGARILDVDRMAHEVLLEPEVKSVLRNRWGDGIFDANGEVLRHQVARRVFQQNEQGREDLKFLESISHPRVTEKLRDELAELKNQDIVVVLDAAVMLKAGWEKHCDIILFVDASREIRLARAKTRDWTEQQFADREARQESLEYKRSLADVVIANGADLKKTQTQIDRFWQTIPSQEV